MATGSAWWLPGMPGSCAELAAIPAARAIRIPDRPDPKVAVALMLQGITAPAVTGADGGNRTHNLSFTKAPLYP